MKAFFTAKLTFQTSSKTGGYNLESTHATGQLLIGLIFLIAAYTIAVLAGRNFRKMGLQQYVTRLQELKRYARRHSAFWVGLYGCLSVGAMEFCSNLAITLMRFNVAKLPHFQRGLHAMTLIQSTCSLLVTPSGGSPKEGKRHLLPFGNAFGKQVRKAAQGCSSSLTPVAPQRTAHQQLTITKYGNFFRTTTITHQ